jgi:hypothetical protein
MEAQLADHVWSLEDLCALLPKPTVRASTIGNEMIRKALGAYNLWKSKLAHYQ